MGVCTPPAMASRLQTRNPELTAVILGRLVTHPIETVVRMLWYSIRFSRDDYIIAFYQLFFGFEIKRKISATAFHSRQINAMGRLQPASVPWYLKIKRTLIARLKHYGTHYASFTGLNVAESHLKSIQWKTSTLATYWVGSSASSLRSLVSQKHCQGDVGIYPELFSSRLDVTFVKEVAIRRVRPVQRSILQEKSELSDNWMALGCICKCLARATFAMIRLL